MVPPALARACPRRPCVISAALLGVAARCDGNRPEPPVGGALALPTPAAPRYPARRSSAAQARDRARRVEHRLFRLLRRRRPSDAEAPDASRRHADRGHRGRRLPVLLAGRQVDRVHHARREAPEGARERRWRRSPSPRIATGDYKAAAWLDDETIVYVDRRSWFTRVSADGGTGSAAGLHEAGQCRLRRSRRCPVRAGSSSLCNGNCAVQSDLYVYDLARDSARLVVPKAAGGWYSPTGHLLYTGRDGGLYAVGFDLGGSSRGRGRSR